MADTPLLLKIRSVSYITWERTGFDLDPYAKLQAQTKLLSQKTLYRKKLLRDHNFIDIIAKVDMVLKEKNKGAVSNRHCPIFKPSAMVYYIAFSV